MAIKKGKVREQVNQAARLDADDYEYVLQKGHGATFNQSLRILIHTMQGIEAQALLELRGYFTSDEWKFMADILMLNSDIITTRDELGRIIMQAKNLNAKTDLYGISLPILIDKIRSLNTAHILAACERVHGYWLEYGKGIVFEEWANY